MIENKNFTTELQNVLEYINSFLITEFPNNSITQEYLITAILDNKHCHAHMMLKHYLMNSNLNELKNIFIDYLRNHSLKTKMVNEPKIDDTITNILNNAVIEKDICQSKQIGTEHVLLSMINPINENNKIIDIFKNVGIDYNFLITKFNEQPKKSESKSNASKKNMQQLPLMNFLPLKSDINPKNVMGKTNYIQSYTLNLNALAKEGKIDDVIGREKETTQIIKILARRKKNNVILVGKGGTGKTSLVYNLANLIERGEVPDIMKDKKIVMLNIASLIAGTYLRGAFEERIKGLFDEMKSNGNYILFIDDMHTVLKSSTKEKDTDISSMINEVLSEGAIRIIGTTSFKDYRLSIESNTMIARRLQKIIVEPSSKEETLEILHKNKHYYEDFHNVQYTEEALKKCVDLADRYITDRSLPDSAVDVIDLCGANTCLKNRKPQEVVNAELELASLNEMKSVMLENGDFENAENLIPQENKLKSIISDFEREFQKNINDYRITVDTNAICQSISEITNIPLNKLTIDEKKKLVDIDGILKSSIIGQDEAIEDICKVIKRNKIGLGDKSRTNGVFFLLGQSGTGKTLLAKKLAEEIYGDANALIRIDMSEFSEKSSVSKLIGASAGYIGYDNGGQLTEAVKNKPHCVLLLDEIEKADKEVHNLFLQVFDEGRMTDNSGQLINFKNVIILMTSNVGTRKAQELGSGMGFTQNEGQMQKGIITKELKNKFTPEFLNRIDKVIMFNNLTDENINAISRLELNKFSKRFSELGYNLAYTDEVIKLIADECIKKKEYGARPILRYIQDNIEDLLTNLILINEYNNNHTFNLVVKDEQITVE